MNKKEQVYKELCELGSLGVDVGFHNCFRILDRMVESLSNKCLSTSQIVDEIILYQKGRLKMKLYDQKAIDKLFYKWKKMQGNIETFGEGCLLSFDLAILTKEGYKNIVIKEQYLNEWSSAYKVRQYKKLPKKYNNN